MNEVQIFENEEFGSIRTIYIDNEVWFVGKDITNNLGYSNPSKALADHVDDEDKLNNESLSSLGQRGGWLINESGLYSLILSSKLPSAKAFKRWVTKEVLPTIRKHGFYATDKTLDEMLGSEEQTKELLRKLKEEQALRRKNELSYEKLIAEKNELIEVLDEKAEYHDNVLNSERLMQMTLIAKDYGMSATRMNAMLYGYGVQYKVGKTWVLFSKYQNYGFTQTRTIRPRGCEEYIQVMYWTETGRKFIYDFLKSKGVLPKSEAFLQEDVAVNDNGQLCFDFI